MKLKLATLTVLLATFMLAAAKQPAGESTIVGAVLVDMYGSYWIYNEPLRSNLPIRVAVEYVEKEKPTLYTFRLRTDENGYFKIENAPAGKYVLKAIQLAIGQSTHITAASKYGQWAKGKQYRYWGVIGGQMYRNERYLIESIFENEAEDGIIDLGITHLTINANERLGGTPFKSYSPNGQPPWIRLSLIQGGGRLVDLSVVDYETLPEVVNLPLQEKEVTVTMQAPKNYFELDE